MPRNKIKQDFNFTTLKEFKIIKLTTCDSQGKIEKSFSPKLTDYFIRGVRKEYLPPLKIGTGLSF